MKASAAVLLSRLRVPLDGSVSGARLRRWKLPVALIILGCVTYSFFYPIFDGYTLSDVARRQNQVYPWAHRKTERPGTVHFDQADTFYPWQVFINQALRSGEFPLWNPYSFAGHPFFANGQNGLLYFPRTYLSIVATPTRVHDWLLLSHMLLGGLMMFLLLSDVRLTFGASLFGSLAWMTNSFMLSWMALEHYVVIHAWLPLAMLLIRRAARRRSWPAAIGAGVILGLMFLGGNILFVELTFAALGLCSIYLVARQLRKHRKSVAGIGARRLLSYTLLLMIPAIVCAGLIAVQFLPTWEIVASIDRAPLTYTELVKWRLDWSDLKYFFLEPQPMAWSPLGVAEDPYHRMLFLGTPTAVLALIGFWRKNPLVSFWRWVAVFILLVALGTPLTWVAYKIVPGFAHLKPLGRVLFLFNFSAAVLAAFGMDWLLKDLPGLIRLKLEGSWDVLWRFTASAALTVIVALQLAAVGGWVMGFQTDDPELLYPETDLTQKLPRNDSTRILALHPAFYGSAHMALGLQNAGGYDSLLPSRTSKLWRVMQGSTPTSAAGPGTASAFATTFTLGSRIDLLPRVGVTHLVTAPLVTVLGCRGEPKQGDSVSKVRAGAGLLPLMGDWNGDGIDSIGLYDPATGTFRLWNSDEKEEEDIRFTFGTGGQGLVPLVGDWDGDRIDTPALYDPHTSTFRFLSHNAPDSRETPMQYGPPGKGWLPVAGDWNSDGLATIGLYDPARGLFNLKNQPRGRPDDEIIFEFGVPGDVRIPIAGDWNGDRVDSVGLYYPADSVFHLRNIHSAGMADIVVQYGSPRNESLPLVGDWIRGVGRGRSDVVGTFDPSSATFNLCAPSFFGEAAQRLEHVYASKDGNIYDVKKPVPRAFLVYGHEPAATSEAALRRFTDPAFDPTRAVIIEDQYLNALNPRPRSAPLSGGESAGQTEILGRSVNSLTVRVQTPSDAWLVVMESWDQGWTANVDGNPVTVVPGNYAFRAVRAPAGDHTVEMVYQPASFKIGRLVSGSTLVLLLAIVIAWQARRTRASVGGE